MHVRKAPAQEGFCGRRERAEDGSAGRGQAGLAGVVDASREDSGQWPRGCRGAAERTVGEGPAGRDSVEWGANGWG